MDEHILNVRLRLVIIKEGKLLTEYNRKKDFYFYIGGHLEYGETILEGCEREVKEECGQGTKFKLKKVLYVRDFFDPDNGEQNVELFILGDIDKFAELEHHLDPQHPEGHMWLTWQEMESLPENLFPKPLTKKLVRDYQNGFPKAGEYVGRMDSR
jgi:ADP-ribose pyrophosphatase YjhB (NUDIX family)